ncbi:MAG: succinylglutamate desuccinylase/aspartoacylase family protein [Cyclobacteriaceae bacterium]|nr:succinylglutamate desuccinylase/aspartoacylase family protein [Cyclobacteriaceae bacterium HetDA_MAG_MS6]
MDRLLGKIQGDQPGPLVICIAALHGNEQIGIHAFRNVYSSIVQNNIPFRGKFIGILGNIKAIESNRRFIDYDLNRSWDDEHFALISGGEGQGQEDEEQLAISDLIQQESQGVFDLKILADLHSTSSDKGNFIVVPEDEANHPVIKALHLPVVVDLDRYLKGTLLSYYHHQGYVSFAFEGGMIGTEQVYQLHTSGLWEILETAGCISRHDHEHQDHYAKNLALISQQLPKQVKALHRHLVKKGDGFRMLPGFHNFQQIVAGQQLAIDHQGPIHSPMDGMIFMPLYQSEGDDGFFIVKEVGEEVVEHN